MKYLESKTSDIYENCSYVKYKRSEMKKNVLVNLRIFGQIVIILKKMSKTGAVNPSLLNKYIPDRSLKITTADLSVEETTSKN